MTSKLTLSTTALSAAGILLGTAVLPAGSAFAAAGCGADATLVSEGICEVTFLETPDAAWTPPAGITKLQALLVGAGGSGNHSGSDPYGGGGGGVQLYELAPTGDVTVHVGIATAGAYQVNVNDTKVIQGTNVLYADGGKAGHLDRGDWGGTSGNGFSGYNHGGGAGAEAPSNDQSIVGEGLVVNEIDPDTFDLFADDDECLGGGGPAWQISLGNPNTLIQHVIPACGTASLVTPEITSNLGYWDQFVGDMSNVFWMPAVPNSGAGGASVEDAVEGVEDTLGEDGKVVLRYDAVLASTGFDATGAIAAGAALVAGGVALAARRRRVSN